VKQTALIVGVVLAVFAVASPPEKPAAETVGWGDFEIFLDNAAFRSPAGGTTEEIYLRVRNSGVRFKEVKGKLEAKLRLQMTVVDFPMSYIYGCVTFGFAMMTFRAVQVMVRRIF